MRREYNYIRFQLGEEKKRTTMWYCRNRSSDDWLATIAWYGAWRQYCIIEFNDCAVFNSQCLKDIADFLDNLNKRHKEKKNDS